MKSITLWALGMGIGIMSSASGNDWTPETKGTGFTTGRDRLLLPLEGRLTPALVLAFPWQQPSQAGEYAQWQTTLDLPGGASALSFVCQDDFAGPTKGYHVVQVLVDNTLVWERDVAGNNDWRRQRVPLPETPQTVSLTVRLFEKKAVENFGVTVQVAGLTLHAGGKPHPLLSDDVDRKPFRELPPDLPLPALPAQPGWTRNANIVQPWGQTQAVAMWEATTWAPRLAREFGFDAMILLPPAAHNRVPIGKASRPRDIDEKAFHKVLATYRREGMKIILYTSIMHVGHDPAWQFGHIAEKHPEWAQRDVDGGFITTYGHPWLCPSTGALDYTLDYTARLVRTYHADAVMLDNNQFFRSDAGKATCYCPACHRKFREYVHQRFTPQTLRDTLGLEWNDIHLPTRSDDPLWGLWLHWRKRIWAEALETYRVRLRAINPDIVVLANTQYLSANWLLAVDEQYSHEDVILSESRGHDGAGMAAKMTLGRALAGTRPLWNYIGTFEEKDFTRLRSPERVRGICAASMGAGANPWIVFYGFTGKENQPSIEVLTRYMAFWHRHATLLAGGREAARVALLFSPETRDFTGRAMPPPWLETILGQRIAIRGMWEPRTCPATELAGCRIIIAPAICLRRESADHLIAWVRQGGTLITTPSTGWRDACGRYRDNSVLNTVAGAPVSLPGEHHLGRGRILCLEREEHIPQRLKQLVQPDILTDTKAGVFRRTLDSDRHVLAIAGFEGPIGRVVVPGLPPTADVSLDVPGAPQQQLTTTADGRLSFDVPEFLAILSWTPTQP